MPNTRFVALANDESRENKFPRSFVTRNFMEILIGPLAALTCENRSNVTTFLSWSINDSDFFISVGFFTSQVF